VSPDLVVAAVVIVRVAPVARGAGTQALLGEIAYKL
jgi:hypothetical protein